MVGLLCNPGQRQHFEGSAVVFVSFNAPTQELQCPVSRMPATTSGLETNHHSFLTSE